MNILTAIVGLLAGLLTIYLRVRELKKGKDPRSLKEQSESMGILGVDGKVVQARRIVKPSMLVPAFGFTFMLQVMSLLSGLVGGVGVALNLGDLRSIENEYGLLFSSISDPTNEEAAMKALSVLLFDVFNSTVGLIITAASFPLYFFLAFPRAFITPAKCFSRATVMGMWVGLLNGTIEFVAWLVLGLGVFEGIGMFIMKFLVFLTMGVLIGLLYTLFRKALPERTVRRLLS